MAMAGERVIKQNILVRFPPWKSVEDLIEFPAFDLPKDGVNVNVTEWKGACDPFGELVEAWVLIESIHLNGVPGGCSVRLHYKKYVNL